LRYRPSLIGRICTVRLQCNNSNDNRSIDRSASEELAAVDGTGGIVMRALLASLLGGMVLISCGDAGCAQPSAVSKPDVVSITGIGIVLPRQAGTKDAPNISLARPGDFELQSATSVPANVDSVSTTGSTPVQERKRQRPRR